MSLSQQRSKAIFTSGLVKIEMRIQEVLAIANEMFDLELNPTVKFKARGRTIGRAGWERDFFGRETTSLNINPEAVEKDFDHVYENTIPHEIAHLVCFSKPSLGKDHNKG